MCPNTDQKKLRIWTLFTQCSSFYLADCHVVVSSDWLSPTRFLWLPSKLELNFDLVLGSLLGNRPQLTTQSLLLVERYFRFQASIWLFARHHVYLQMFQLCELRANDFNEFRLLAVQCLCFENILDFASFSLLQCLQGLFAPPRPKFICDIQRFQL